MRKLVKKYNSEELVSFYNHYVQDYALGNLGVQPCIHILDCTKIPVNLSNTNYENSSVVTNTLHKIITAQFKIVIPNGNL